MKVKSWDVIDHLQNENTCRHVYFGRHYIVINENALFLGPYTAEQAAKIKRECEEECAKITTYNFWDERSMNKWVPGGDISKRNACRIVFYRDNLYFIKNKCDVVVRGPYREDEAMTRKSACDEYYEEQRKRKK